MKKLFSLILALTITCLMLITSCTSSKNRGDNKNGGNQNGARMNFDSVIMMDFDGAPVLIYSKNNHSGQIVHQRMLLLSACEMYEYYYEYDNYGKVTKVVSVDEIGEYPTEYHCVIGESDGVSYFDEFEGRISYHPDGIIKEIVNDCGQFLYDEIGRLDKYVIYGDSYCRFNYSGSAKNPSSYAVFEDGVAEIQVNMIYDRGILKGANASDKYGTYHIEYTYDSNSNPIKEVVTHQDNDGDVSIMMGECIYDASGNIARITSKYYGRYVSEEYPADQTVIRQMTYNQSGLITRMEYSEYGSYSPESDATQVEEYEYNTAGKRVRTTSVDKNNTKTVIEYRYDADGRLESDVTTIYGPGELTGKWYVITYFYNDDVCEVNTIKTYYAESGAQVSESDWYGM